jgi:hypothetical protein
MIEKGMYSHFLPVAGERISWQMLFSGHVSSKQPFVSLQALFSTPVSALTRCLPRPHVEHNPAPAPEYSLLPHELQVGDAARDAFPAAQTLQVTADVAPIDALAFPRSQLVQDDEDSVFEYFPTSHAVHLWAAAPEYAPFEQASQAVTLSDPWSLLNLPALQAAQNDA